MTKTWNIFPLTHKEKLVNVNEKWSFHLKKWNHIILLENWENQIKVFLDAGIFCS